jgi:hypothetical protein
VNKFLVPVISRVLMITILFSITQNFNLVAFSENQNSTTPYKDIENHWAKEPILKLIEADVVHGFYHEDGTLEIRPDEFISRAEILSLLITAAGLVEVKGPQIQFSDVGEDDWFKGIVDIGVSHGITKGYPDGTFKPFHLVNRAEMTLWMAKTFHLTLKELEGVKNPYKDISSGDWFFETVISLSEIGLMRGYPDNTFLPFNNATRAETIAVIVKAIEDQSIRKNKEDLTLEIENPLEDLVFEEKGTKEEGSSYEGIDPDSLEAQSEDENLENEKKDSVHENDADERKEEAQDEKPEGDLKDEQEEVAGEESIAEPVNPFIDVAPEIVVRKPFPFGQTQIETTDQRITVEIRVLGNPLESITYDVHNFPGDGMKNEIVKGALGKTLFVTPQGFQERVDLEILVPNMEDGINEVLVSVVDIYGNQSQTTFRFLHLRDSNGDGIMDYYKRKMGVHPTKPDGDGDGLEVWEEVLLFNNRLSPIFYSSVGNGVSDGNLDYDGDGLTNFLELRKYGTDPTNPDTDGDGLPDGVEIYEYGIDPLNRDSLKNGRLDFSNVVRGIIPNIKKNQSTIQLPENSFGAYGISPAIDLNQEVLKAGDKRVEVVLKTQLLINRLLSESKKETHGLAYTGQFNQRMMDSLFASIGVNQVNGPTFREMVRRVGERPVVKDEIPQNVPLMGYSPYDDYEGVRYIKMLLEKWREIMAPSFHALYTIPTLYEEDGRMTGVFDSLMVAHLKLFQVHNGLLGTGVLNDATMEKLLAPINTWTVKREFIARDFLLQESFGRHAFFRYSREGQSPLDPVYYGQTYGVWHKEPYFAIKRGVAQNNRTIATSGCGPAAVAMVVATLKDPTIDPGDIARLSMENDFMTASSGTEGRLYPFVANQYGIKYEYSSNIHYVMGYLEKGTHLAIASLGQGHFTDGGHVFTLTGVIQLPGEDFKRVIVYDPDTGNKNYGSGDGVIRSRKPGVVYARPDVLQREMAIGFWLMWD